MRIQNGFFSCSGGSNGYNRERSSPSRLPAQHHLLDAMPVQDCQTKPSTGSRTRQYVNLRFCLQGSRKTCRFLNELAGTSGYLWNTAHTKSKHDYTETGQSQTSPFDLCKWYNEHRDTAAPWLRQYSVDLPCTARKDLSDACKQFFQKKRGLPRFKEKGKAKKSFAVDVSGERGVQRMDTFGKSWACM